jgi:hypothetical protein
MTLDRYMGTRPMVWTRASDKVYCCPTAAKPPVVRAVHSTFSQYLQVKKRADERTRTADLLITSLFTRFLVRPDPSGNPLVCAAIR